MSLATANLMETVKKQFIFKLKANIDAFSSLVGIQFLAILFSLGGSSSYMSSSENLHMQIKYYSADVVIVFTMIWALVTAITITTKPYRNQDFTFVTNRLSSSLSNILFLLAGSLLGAVTAILSRYVTQVIGYFGFNENLYSAPISIGEIFLGISMSLIYIFCISSIGYLIGTLVQVNKLFSVVVPVLVIGSLFLDAMMGREPFLIKLFQFYVMESSVVFFTLKMIGTSAVFFLASISILNRMEVRR
jgi:hypothetical protein